MDSSRKIESKSYHVTTNATNTPWSGSVQLMSLVISVTGAGTTWAITVQSKEATPKILYEASPVAVGNFSMSLYEGVELTNGIDIITSGTTPGTLDVFVTAKRYSHD